MAIQSTTVTCQANDWTQLITGYDKLQFRFADPGAAGFLIPSASKPTKTPYNGQLGCIPMLWPVAEGYTASDTDTTFWFFPATDKAVNVVVTFELS